MAQKLTGIEHWNAQRIEFISQHQFKYSDSEIPSWRQNETLNSYTDAQILSFYSSLVDGRTLARRLPLSFITHVLSKGWNSPADLD